ncbi:MAG: rod shape-determining protein [Candidatus Dormibacteria bacterium]
MLGKRLGIDLGTGSLRAVVRGEGPVLTEPMLVARHRRRGDAAAGMAAVDLARDDDMEIVRPLGAGVIADRNALATLLHQVVNRVAGRQRIFRPDVVIAICPAMGGDDRLAILDICAKIGTRTAYLIDSPIAAAMGAGHLPAGGRGHLVADIGSGTVDVASLVSEGTIASRTLPAAGDALRAAIAERLEASHHAFIEPAVADDVVASLACVGPHEERRMPVRAGSGAGPITLSIASLEIADLVDAHARQIAQAIDEVLEETPLALRHDILEEGVILCGGGARLEGLDRYLGIQTRCAVNLAPDPSSCVIRGTQAAVENLDVLRRSFMYIR